MNQESEQLFPINVTSQRTGFSKFVLRVWERRYGFPTPLRDSQGDRLYTYSEIEKLNMLRSLMEQGFRISKIVELSITQLEDLHKTLNSDENNPLTNGYKKRKDLVFINQKQTKLLKQALPWIETHYNHLDGLPIGVEYEMEEWIKHVKGL